VLCENCHKKKAIVKLTEIGPSGSESIYLCLACAENEGINIPLLNISKIFKKIITSLLMDHLKIKSIELEKIDELDNESLSFVWQFKSVNNKGEADLAEDNDIQDDELTNFLNEILDAEPIRKQNTADQSVLSGETKAALQIRLKKAVQNEEYELAAQLRDQICELS